MKHIEAVLQTRLPERKTDIWIVWPKDDREPTHALGLVEWFTRWRCYVFRPVEGTVYERTCLRDLAEFCEQQTKDHKERARAEAGGGDHE